MPKHEWIRKTLVLGSGAIKIGEAAEFDYSGSQCLKALSEEGIESVLVNPNIATIQTDPQPGRTIYLLPVTADYVEKVIRKERPDSILLGFGGQTALNCGVELARCGILDKYKIRVLGTPIRTIQETEDRELFKQAMLRSATPTPASASTNTVEEVFTRGRADRLSSNPSGRVRSWRKRVRRRMEQGTDGKSSGTRTRPEYHPAGPS